MNKAVISKVFITTVIMSKISSIRKCDIFLKNSGPFNKTFLWSKFTHSFL